MVLPRGATWGCGAIACGLGALLAVVWRLLGPSDRLEFLVPIAFWTVAWAVIAWRRVYQS